MSVDNGLSLDIDPGTEIEYWDAASQSWLSGVVVGPSPCNGAEGNSFSALFVRNAAGVEWEVGLHMSRAIGSNYEV